VLTIESMRTPLAIAAVSTLALAACGSGGDDAGQLPDAEQLIDDAEQLGISPLAVAFGETAAAPAFQMEMSVGMSMDIGFGDAIDIEADPSRPMITAAYDVEGEQHMVMDMGAIMDAAGVGGLLGDDIGMEMWLDGTTMYADLGSPGPMMSSAGLGIPDGIFTVDLSAVGASVGGADIATSVTGQAMPDPVELATVLGEVLTDVEGDGSSYTGTIGFLDYARAMGQEPADLTGGLGDLSAGDGALVGPMLEAFETLEVAVAVELEGEAVDTVRFDVDMAPLFTAMLEAFGDAGAEGDVMSRMFADATMTMVMVIDYDIDPSIDVQIPEGDFPDVTADFVEFLSMGGGPFG